MLKCKGPISTWTDTSSPSSFSPNSTSLTTGPSTPRPTRPPSSGLLPNPSEFQTPSFFNYLISLYFSRNSTPINFYRSIRRRPSNRKIAGSNSCHRSTGSYATPFSKKFKLAMQRAKGRVAYMAH